MTRPMDNYFDQGLDYLAANEYEKAIDMLTRAFRLSLGDLAEILVYRGIAYAYLERYEEAYRDFNLAIRRNPDMPDAYNERGNILRFHGEYQQAIVDYTQAVRIDPQHTEAYYNRALAHQAVGNLERAEADLTRTLDLDPTIAAAYELRGRLRARLYDYDGAIDDLQRYLRMGGGREFDNHSDVQSYLINLRLNKWLSKIVPARLLPGNHA